MLASIFLFLNTIFMYYVIFELELFINIIFILAMHLPPNVYVCVLCKIFIHFRSRFRHSKGPVREGLPQWTVSDPLHRQGTRCAVCVGEPAVCCHHEILYAIMIPGGEILHN